MTANNDPDLRVESTVWAMQQLALIMDEYRARIEKVASARARQALMLQREGFTYDRIAQEVGVSRTVVARMIARGKADEDRLSAEEMATVIDISTAALASGMNEKEAVYPRLQLVRNPMPDK